MRFEIHGKLRGKDRPRMANGHAYTAKETRDYEKAVIVSYRLAGGRCLTKSVDDPIKIRLIAVHEPNKSDTKKVRARKLANEIPCTLKPDDDNMLKIVQDALQGGVAFHDDRQVVQAEVIKCFGETEKLIVDVDVMGDYTDEIRGIVDGQGI